MKLDKRVTLHHATRVSTRLYEVDLCEVGEGRYVVNYRYGYGPNRLQEAVLTRAPVDLQQATRLFDEFVEQKIGAGYTIRASQGAEELIEELTNAPRQPQAHPSLTTTDEGQQRSTRPQPQPQNEERRRQARFEQQARLEEARNNKRSREIPTQYPPAPDDERALAVVERLRRGHESDDGWPLSRAMWRAGELELQGAAAPLIQYLENPPTRQGNRSQDQMERYSAVWALGRIGAPEAREALETLPSSAPMIRRITTLALLEILDGEARQEFLEVLAGGLPEPLQRFALQGPAEDFDRALREALEGGDEQAFQALETAYFLGTEHTRGAVVRAIDEASIRPGWWRALRHIFKAAEFRRDGEVFGILARLFEGTPPRFHQSHSWGKGVAHTRPNERWMREVGQYWGRSRSLTSITGDSTDYGWSNHTRDYMVRRCWRTMRRMAELGDPSYVRLAVGALLQVNDEDARPAASQGRYTREGGNWSWRTQHYDRFATFMLFNRILYGGNSPRYREQSKRFVCINGYQPGQPAPLNVREEAYPELWDREPRGLLHLIDESRNAEVHHFAVRALRDNQEFLDRLPLAVAVMMLTSPYEVTAALGLELVRARYDAAKPDREMLLTVIDSVFAPAREQAEAWIDAAREQLKEDTDFLERLADAERQETRRYARDLLQRVVLPDEVERALADRLIAAALRHGATTQEDESGAMSLRAIDLVETVRRAMPRALQQLGWRRIEALARHPMASLQGLAGDAAALRSDEELRRMPWDVVASLLSSPYEASRAAGMRLFGRLDEETLLEREELLASLSVHRLEDLRNAIRATIRRLAAAHPDFGRRMLETLVEVLRHEERHEGIHASVVQLIVQDLSGQLEALGHETIFALLGAPGAEAQDLGVTLLERNVEAQDLRIVELVELASHELVRARQLAWRWMLASLDRLRAQLPLALTVLDSDWEDTRQFAFSMFREHLGAADLTPGLLVSITDSVRPDVQAFGREMIGRHFDDEHGQEYLTKLSEHPSQDLQLYATNYLERYAAGDAERLAELEPYFLTVLSAVNRSRAARDRVVDFLSREAQRGEQAARVVARIMARQSATMAIGDRARYIEAMVQIHHQYPDIPLPLEWKPVEVRHHGV